MLRKYFFWLATAIIFAPAAASACPACFVPSTPGALYALYLSRVLLISAPFLMVGFVAAVMYCANRSRARAAAARDPDRVVRREKEAPIVRMPPRDPLLDPNA